MERRSVPLSITPVTLEERDGTPPKIVGYASVFYDGTPASEYRFSDVVERIMPTAFDYILQNSQDVRALYNHDANYVLGRTKAGTLTLTKDGRGLMYVNTPPDGPVGQTVREALRRGDVTGSSFSFGVSKKGQTWTRTADGLYLREIHSFDVIHDVGPVTFPAYVGSSAGIRSDDKPEALDEYKQAVDAAMRTKHGQRLAEMRAAEIELLNSGYGQK